MAATTVADSVGDAGYTLNYDGDSITWLMLQSRPSREDTVPGGNSHPNYWQIRRHDFADDVTDVIAQGVNHWITDDSSVHDPYVAFDGDLIAYDVETPGPDKNARIIVQSISSGEIVRTIDVGSPVFDIVLSGGDVTYLTGQVADGTWGSPDDPQLILSQADGQVRHLPYNADVSMPISFDENGTTVMETFPDPASALSDLSFASSVGTLNTQPSDSRDLQHGDGLVVWRSRKLEDGHPIGDQVSVFDTDTHQIAVLDEGVPFEWAIFDVSGLGDGWLIWISEDETTGPDGGFNLTAHAVRTSDVHAAFAALVDGQ